MTYPLLKVLRVLVGECELLAEPIQLTRHIVQFVRCFLVLVVESLFLNCVCVHFVFKAFTTHL